MTLRVTRHHDRGDEQPDPDRDRPLPVAEMTPEQLAAIEARCNRATAEPWTSEYEDGDWGSAVTADDGLEVATTRQIELGARFFWNAEFIAHARADVPALIAEVRRLQAAEQAVKAYEAMEGGE